MNKIIAAAIAIAVITPGAALAAKGPSVKVGGGIQADYRLGDANGKTTAQGFGNHEFNMRRARLIVSGKVNSLVGFGATLQGDNSGNSAPTFRDMFATIAPSPLTKFTIGQFKYEFDMEGRESSFDRSFMDRTLVTNTVAGGASGAFRDKGVQLSGAIDMAGMGAGYALGVFQGQGFGSDASTGTSTTVTTSTGGTTTVPAASSGGNNKFMYTANLFVKPMPGLKLNGGYMNNDRTASNTTAPALENRYSAWTAGVAYETGPLLARAEYYRGRQNTAGVSTTPKGGYVMGVFRATPDIDLMARYQTIKVNEVANSSQHSTDLGVKYYLAHKGRFGGTNLAVNYMMRSADANASNTLLNDGRGRTVTGADVRNVVAARMQVAF